MKRREFLKCAGKCAGLCGATGLVGLPPTAQAAGSAADKAAPLMIRPYQLLCTVCSLGADDASLSPHYARAMEIREAIRKNPDVPVTLSCQVGAIYSFQDSGTSEDTPEGEEYNRKRDFEVLEILGLPPGSTLPARALFELLMKGLPSISGICGYGKATGEAWKGCPMAETGNYENGYCKGVKALIPPRDEKQMAKDKAESLQAMYSADVVPVRAHILVCAVCQYGEGLRPGYKEDNLPELLDVILNRNPDLKIRLVAGADWMICAPCPGRNPELNCCIHVMGSGELDSQKRDLDLLQKLGLRFGTVMKARDLYKLIFERITTTHGIPDICIKQNTMPSVWWDECCGHLFNGNPRALYEKGRRAMMKKLGLEEHA
ncbi:MAG: DUF1284 domain-containing protein [Kiritimatiellae bacterium]|nr:DUF1284 domain-containing protein [Kiritimatiellia bacterium]